MEAIMATLAITKMPSKRKSVIPEEVHKRLNLKAGAQFVVVDDNDVVILKPITEPSMDEFDGLITDVPRKTQTVE